MCAEVLNQGLEWEKRLAYGGIAGAVAGGPEKDVGDGGVAAPPGCTQRCTRPNGRQESECSAKKRQLARVNG